MNTAAGCDSPQRTSRVDGLLNSVSQVNELLNRIEGLADLLGINIPPKSMEPLGEVKQLVEPKRNTLVGLLNELPMKISNSTESAHQLLSQIENELS
jgi:hypothetical protein